MARRLVFILVMLLISLTLAAQVVNVDRRGVAVKGYDVVAYFTEGKAVRGSADITFEYEKAIYQFASEDHRDLFVEEPERYVPQYGGYCAYAVSRGYTASIQPQQWVIEDDRLFLNFSRGVNRSFNADLKRNIQRADDNWPQIYERLDEDDSES